MAEETCLSIAVTNAVVGLTERYMLVRCVERWPQTGTSALADVPCTALRHVSVKQRASVMRRGLAAERASGMNAKRVVDAFLRNAECGIAILAAAMMVVSKKQGCAQNVAANFNQRTATERHAQRNARRQEAGGCFNATTERLRVTDRRALRTER